MPYRGDKPDRSTSNAQQRIKTFKILYIQVSGAKSGKNISTGIDEIRDWCVGCFSSIGCARVQRLNKTGDERFKGDFKLRGKMRDVNRYGA
jgi:hypothetical protein